MNKLLYTYMRIIDFTGTLCCIDFIIVVLCHIIITFIFCCVLDTIMCVRYVTLYNHKRKKIINAARWKLSRVITRVLRAKVSSHWLVDCLLYLRAQNDRHCTTTNYLNDRIATTCELALHPSMKSLFGTRCNFLFRITCKTT